jgi:cellulose biosynthesis protein BcsQ/tetratricopeptide (TPR) repeat protein
MPDVTAEQRQDVGQIVTFYSFKGGTGRTMALANVAWILAANGERVLIVDWDLESPGLHRFFQPFMDPGVAQLPGVVDFIRTYEWQMEDEIGRLLADNLLDEEAMRWKKPALDAIAALIDENVSGLSRLVKPVGWQFPGRGAIDFLSPGAQTNDGVYAQALSALEWDTLYDKLNGGQFLDALRERLKRSYDWILIDSRTGLSDIASICTLHLPDSVIDCFTLSRQGLEGAAQVAGQIEAYTSREIKVLPVPMRIDHSREDKVVDGLDAARELFAGLPANMSDDQRAQYWAEVQVPYRPLYAYEETLAAFGDRPGVIDSLLSSYERIAARITANKVTRLPPRQEWLRLSTWRMFSRSAVSRAEIVVDFSPQDQLWAEWIAAALASAGHSARLVGEQARRTVDGADPPRVVGVLSDFYLSRREDSEFAPVLESDSAGENLGDPEYLIDIADTQVPSGVFDGVPVGFIGDLPEERAVSRLIEGLGGSTPPQDEPLAGGVRYPGDSSRRIERIPARNVNFTGRNDFLRHLREALRSRGRAVVLQQPDIEGPGGIGKTQVALEYAHRFKEDYDVVYWLNCEPAQYVDAALVDLGKQLREEFGASLPEEGGVTELARQVLKYLSELETQRWLLIYDNAEDIERITENLLPASGGHVLITSRNQGWEARSAQGQTLRLGLFERQESVSHLRRRLPGIDVADADQLAAELADMPLAVAAAGALLNTDKLSVPEYLDLLKAEPVRPLRPDHELRAYPEAVVKAWHLSVDRLERRSAAAARLLEMSSVMVPEISFDLIYSEPMVVMVRDLDPTISEPAMIAKLVTQIDDQALIKVDRGARQIQVHRVFQTIMRERMSADEVASARRNVHSLLVAARPKGDVDDPQLWQGFRQLWPHVRPSQAERSTREDVRDLLVDRIRYLWQRDDLEPGSRRARHIEEAWVEMLAAEPDADSDGAKLLRKQLYRLRFNLANILRNLGQFEESRALDEAVLSAQEQELGPAHPHTLQTRGSLAADLRALGKYRQALTLDQATYESWALNSGFGEDYGGTLFAANNLALSSLLNGRYRDALRRDRQTLKRRSTLYRPGYPRTLTSGTAVARDLIEGGQYQEAADMLVEVVNQSHRWLGDDARITLNARLWLGVAQRCAGDPVQAAPNIEAAMTGLSRGFGPNSNDALASRLSYALNQLALKQVAEGRKALEEVLAVYEGWLGTDHPHVLISELNVATALCLEGKYADAQAHVERAVNGLSDTLSPTHTYTLSAKLVWASVLAYLGKLEDAAEVEETVFAERTEWLGFDHPDTLRCRANLLLTRHQQGANGGTGDRQRVISQLESVLGANHPDVIAAAASRRLLCVVNPQPF